MDFILKRDYKAHRSLNFWSLLWKIEESPLLHFSMSDPIFQRGLQDLIKGIRSHKRDPSAFISQGIAEIKSELSSTDPVIKAEAVSANFSIFPLINCI